MKRQGERNGMKKIISKISPCEFENWAVIALGGIPNKAQVGGMGIDGRIFPVGSEPKAFAKESSPCRNAGIPSR